MATRMKESPHNVATVVWRDAEPPSHSPGYGDRAEVEPSELRGSSAEAKSHNTVDLHSVGRCPEWKDYSDETHCGLSTSGGQLKTDCMWKQNHVEDADNKVRQNLLNVIQALLNENKSLRKELTEANQFNGYRSGADYCKRKDSNENEADQPVNPKTNARQEMATVTESYRQQSVKGERQIDAVERWHTVSKSRKKSGRNYIDLENTENLEEKTLKACRYCGYKHIWGKTKCKAFDGTCRICLKENHFAIVCRSRNKMKKEMAKVNTEAAKEAENSRQSGSDTEVTNAAAITEGVEASEEEDEMIRRSERNDETDEASGASDWEIKSDLNSDEDNKKEIEKHVLRRNLNHVNGNKTINENLSETNGEEEKKTDNQERTDNREK